MKCKKCGAELPDLTMYCTSCGAPQFESETPDIHLTVPENHGCKVIITGCSNMTNALTKIHALTGMSIPEVRKTLSALPATLFDQMSASEAEATVAMLRENEIEAIVEGNEPKETASESTAPVQTEPKPETELQMPDHAPAEQKKETGINLTLQPEGDDAFMAEMNAFLNDDKKAD